MKLTLIEKDITKTLTYDAPVLLSDAARDAGFALEMPCGGGGRCGKCAVEAEGMLSPRTEKEEALFPSAPTMRLACTTRAMGDARVRIVPRETMTDIVTGADTAAAQTDGGDGCGIAVDIGTTTIAAYLLRLSDGARLSDLGRKNPQSTFGADVIARIEHSLAGGGAALQSAVAGCLNEMIAELQRRAGGDAGSLRAVAITGNTAMLYLLTGRGVRCLSAAPFAADCLFGDEIPAKTAGLTLPEDVKVYLMPSISAFVGADITAAILSSGMTEHPENTLLVDIGTNGEMALFSQGRLLCCSTAAGPAFEGAGLTMGMNALAGAIDRVGLSGGMLVTHTIGGGAARGVCGSGVIDALAALLTAGALDETGLLDEEHALVAEYQDEPAAQLAPGVYLTGRDVRALQLAKSAICAGMLTLIHHAGLTPEEIGTLYIAGGFGSFINVKSAAKISLIPPALAPRAKAIGNAAGAGASMALLSVRAREAAARIARTAETVELSTDPYFMEKYVDCMMFE